MEIESVETGLPVDSYLQKPQLPKSNAPTDAKAPPKKKRVMSEKQLENLKKAREKSALNRRLKKEQKVADKEALKEQKKLAKKNKIPIASTTAENLEVVEEESANGSSDDYEEEVDNADEYYAPQSNGIDYEFIMSNVYGMLKEDQHKEKEAHRLALEEQARMTQAKEDYDESIRKAERDRLMGIVKEKKGKQQRPTHNALKPHEPNWDSCFQPRGRGGDNFF
tara:strand:+ start:1207 stop:1875 length:669 start_codon:yes stop_codon:yes gene_type:complete